MTQKTIEVNVTENTCIAKNTAYEITVELW